MFGSDRGKAGSIGTWLILGVLALAFGLTFGLPSDQLSFGEAGLVKVHGENVSQEDFVYQRTAVAQVLGGLPEGEQAMTFGVREEVLEAVIERLVLAHLGEQLGLMTETRDAEELTKDGFYLVLDEARAWPWRATGNFDYKQFQGFLGSFSVSETRFLEIQRQELLARQVRDLLWSSTVIPEAELWAAYERDNNQMSLRYVSFATREFAEIVDPTAEEIDGYIAANPDALAEAWEANQARYLKLPAQVDLRLISIPKPVAPPEGADEELRAAWQARLDEARTGAEQARTRIVDGGESFAAVAREVSRDADTARSGGDFGWTQVTDTGSGLAAIIDETARTLEDGQVSAVIEDDDSFYIVAVMGHREGDVPEEVAQRELAEDAVRRQRGAELAKQAADEALLAVKEAGDFDEVFAPSPALGGDPAGNIEDGLPGAAPTSDRKIQETGLFTYGKAIPGIGANPELSDLAWQADVAAPILDQVFETSDGYLVVDVDDIQKATREGYAEARPELYEKMAEMRSSGVISAFTKRKCFEGKATVDIRVNDRQVAALMNYGDEMYDSEGVRLTPPYRVCDRVGDRGGMLRFSMMMRGRGAAAPPPSP